MVHDNQSEALYRFPTSHEPLPLTGERYIPSVGGQVQHEHFHRYLFALQFCPGKEVLDIACGEGYGAALLGGVARSVIGVDSSPDAVAHAESNYASENVSFLVADACDTTLPDAAIDTVVCFETIEHLLDHDRFVQELCRVLRPRGLLLLSTPNRETYLAGEAPNPFHHRELSRNELVELLGTYFRHTAVGCQESGSSSMILTGNSVTSDPTLFKRLDDDTFAATTGSATPTYLVALATDGELPAAAPSLLIDGLHVPALHTSFRAELDREIGSREQHLARVSALNERLSRALDAASPGAAPREEAALATWLGTCLTQEQAVHSHEFAELERELAVTRRRLSAIQKSTTWRASAPLRLTVARLHALVSALNTTRKKGRLSSSPQLEMSTRRARARSGAYQAWIERYDEITDDDIDAMNDLLGTFADGPTISLLLRVAHAPAGYVSEAIESVIDQVYPRWELCIVQDASPAPNVRRLLETYASSVSCIKLYRPTKDEADASALNRALTHASGEWVALLDPQDRLRPHALFMIATELGIHQHAEFVYSDEDRLDNQGRRSAPYFKPDWDPLLLLGQNYVQHLAAFRRSSALEQGGFRLEFGEGQDLDLFLRLLSGVPRSRVRHIRHVLCHTREDDDPHDARRATLHATHGAARAVRAYLRERGEAVEVAEVGNSSLRVDFVPPEAPPEVDVIVPTTARPDVAEACLDSLLSETTYPRLRVVLVCSESDASLPERSTFLNRVSNDDRVRVLVHSDRPFNWSWANNFGFRNGNGSVLCFLNDDTSVIDDDWLDTLVAHVLRENVGAVGPMLYYPDGTVQHAGVILGYRGIAGHRYVGYSRGDGGPNDRALVSQEISAVTGACMVVRREAFESVAGFDESYQVAFNDIDFCLRLRTAGWRIVWTPSAELCHRESTSTGLHYAPARRKEFDAECRVFLRRWGSMLANDPFYNPNLSLGSGEFASPPRVRYPWTWGTFDRTTFWEAASASDQA